jgi:hypothetical protein
VDEEGNTLASDFYGLGSEIYRDGNFDTVETDSFPEGGLLHHKTMIIDGRKVLSGSYNYSISARSKNREILYWTELPHIVSAFREEFQRIKGSSYRVVPKNFHIKKEESVSILSENFICGKNKLNSPTLEIGSGIWKSYLYYKYPTGTDCISLENFEDISNGIASFKRNKLMENQYFLSNKIYVSGRNSNFTWTNPETQNSFKNYLNPGPGKLETLLFSPSSLILRDSENLLDWKEALLYFPSRGISNYTTQVNQNSIRIESKFDSTQKSQGMIFLSNGKTSKVYCFLSKGEKLDNSIQYFINKIYLSSKEKELLKCYNL